MLNTGLDAIKSVSKKVVHRAGEYVGNKVADAVTQSNDDKIVKPDENPGNIEEIRVPLKKGEKILNELKLALL